MISTNILYDSINVHQLVMIEIDIILLMNKALIKNNILVYSKKVMTSCMEEKSVLAIKKCFII